MKSKEVGSSLLGRLPSDETAFFMLGKLVERDRTDRIFTNPKEQMTEDYITGRFG